MLLTAALAMTFGLAARPISAAIPVRSPLTSVIPLPVTVTAGTDTFTLSATSGLYVLSDTPEALAIANYLAGKLRPSTGYPLPVSTVAAGDTVPGGGLSLALDNSNSALGAEGYTLSITADRVRLSGYQPAGLFHAVQTLRQLLPASIEQANVQPGPWSIPGGDIRDYPRFGWRGFMIDVARHFFPVSEIERQLDLMAYYKLNVLHLHLTDDQGWRLAISSWPALTSIGGSSQVGGGPGGFYSQADYGEIVQYAAARYIMVVPEIDLPGHANAALASYPDLACTDKAPALDTDPAPTFASLCLRKPITATFIDDVIREVAAITPGPYIHIGGDEPNTTPSADYMSFISSVQTVVARYHKQLIGWQDIASGSLNPDVTIQHWNWQQRGLTANAASQGIAVIMSPVPLGERFPGYISLETGYEWDATQIPIIPEQQIRGVEAPLWTEVVDSPAVLDQMAYPWLLGYAENGWSVHNGRTWIDYAARLATHGPRLAALGVNFFASAEIAWVHS